MYLFQHENQSNYEQTPFLFLRTQQDSKYDGGLVLTERLGRGMPRCCNHGIWSVVKRLMMGIWGRKDPCGHSFEEEALKLESLEVMH